MELRGSHGLQGFHWKHKRLTIYFSCWWCCQGDPGNNGVDGEVGQPGFYGEPGDAGGQGETGVEKQTWQIIFMNVIIIKTIIHLCLF